MVDEDAGQPVADRAVDDERGHGAVDAAREAADRARVADLRADALDLLLDDVRRGPGRRAVAGVEEEPLEQVGAERRVDDLGVELDAVEAPGGFSIAATGADCGLRGHRKPSGARTTASRWLIQHCRPGGRRTSRPRPDAQRRLAVLPGPGAGDLPAQREGHRLHAVADAQHRDAELEQRGLSAGAPGA